jgi:hypothetical protein
MASKFRILEFSNKYYKHKHIFGDLLKLNVFKNDFFILYNIFKIFKSSSVINGKRKIKIHRL